MFVEPEDEQELFFTAPSTPAAEFPSPSPAFISPSQVARLAQLSPSHPPPTHSTPHHPGFISSDPLSITDDTFPSPTDIPHDFPLDVHEALSTLEKIYLFSRSNATFHRIFIAHALPDFLEQVSPQEAIEYVLPLLSGLAMDQDEQVKEALVSQLVSVIWWFFSHCQLIPDENPLQPRSLSSSPFSDPPHHPGHPPTISVQAFTPILGTLLLSPNGMVAGAARYSIVNLLQRIRHVDSLATDSTVGPGSPPSCPIHPCSDLHYDGYNDDMHLRVGLFGKRERSLFEQELLCQVVIGMGRLDLDPEPEHSPIFHSTRSSPCPPSPVHLGSSPLSLPPWPPSPSGHLQSSPSTAASHGAAKQDSNINPYFPMFPASTPASRVASTDSNAAFSPATSSVSSSSGSSQSVRSTPSSTTGTTGSMSSMSVSSDSSERMTYTDSPKIATRSSSGSPSLGPLPDGVTLTHRKRKSQDQRLSLHLELQPPHPRQLELAYRHSPSREIPSLFAASNNSPGRRGSPSLSPPMHGLPPHRRSPDRSARSLLPPAVDMEVDDVNPPYSPHGSASGSDSPTPPSAQRRRQPSPSQRSPATSVPPLILSPPEDQGLFVTTSPEPIEALAPGRPFRPAPPPHSELPSPASPMPQRNQIVDMDVDADSGLDPQSAGVMDPVECEQQAAVGRLSSMSLIAAVTASGCLSDPTKQAFVAEVERVSKDSIYWVRREACFALGALAKVVPDEAITLTLLPILQSLLTDSIHHVRHSSLFALPAVLLRLPRWQRRKLALDTLVPMSMDESGDVRAGVLEALGEVIYAFHEGEKEYCSTASRPRRMQAHGGDSVDDPMEEEDEGGGNGKPSEPPDELLRMFLGRRDGDLSEGRSMTIEGASTSPSDDGTRSSGRLLEDIASPLPEPDKAKALDSFYADPSRPLICAFNYPAVALTLGPQLWESHLRSTYLWLATSRDFNVRRTLAASIGELATIMGPERAERDLVTVWRNVVRSEEEDVRMKVVDCLLSFVGAVRGQARAKVLKDVLGVWQDGGWKSWREREGIARGLKGMVAVLNDGWNDGVEMDIWSTVRGLLKCACWDGVSAVREGAIDALPVIWMACANQRELVVALRADVQALGQSETFRGRMTFIACQQALVLPSSDRAAPVVGDDEFWGSMIPPSHDTIVGVRIGVARLVGIACQSLTNEGKSMSHVLRGLYEQLAQDRSPDVRAFILPTGDDHAQLTHQKQGKPHHILQKELQANRMATTFSRPPHPLFRSPSSSLSEV